MIGVKQQADALLAGLANEIAQDVEALHDWMLELILNGQPQLELGGDGAGAADVGDHLVEACGAGPNGAHQYRAIERHGGLAALAEHLEQPLLLVALRGEDPAGLDADAGNRQTALLHEIKRVRIAHEVDTTQLDGIEATSLGGGERLFKRRCIDRPGVKRDAAKAMTRYTRLSAFFHQPTQSDHTPFARTDAASKVAILDMYTNASMHKISAHQK